MPTLSRHHHLLLLRRLRHLLPSSFSTHSLPPPQPPLSDPFLVEKVLLSLKHNNLNSLHNHLNNNLNRSDPFPLIVDILGRCHQNPTLANRFLHALSFTSPNLKHSTRSLGAMVHALTGRNGPRACPPQEGSGSSGPAPPHDQEKRSHAPRDHRFIDQC
ncbi:hypothetical protein S83_021830 [Arachis hypogaea]